MSGNRKISELEDKKGKRQKSVQNMAQRNKKMEDRTER